ncbi:MAG: hypothetical protein R8K21_03505 [Mariprofundales bacterium]
MMKKSFIAAAAFAVTAATTMAMAPTTAEAVPAFARQTGAACLSCHFQAIPRLAAMGRNFRIGGYTDMGDQELLEDDHLSLPATFNASLVFKARIGSSNQPAPLGGAFNSSKSSIQWPDEAALLIGGRYGEHIGGLTEWNSGPLSYKIAFVYDLDFGKVGVIGGSTDALGTGYLFNDPSNVLIRNLRGSQFRPGYFKGTSMQNGVSGLGVYAHINDLVFVSLGQFVSNAGMNPTVATPLGAAALDFLTWARLAVTTEVAGFDTVAGVYSISGTQGKNGATGITKETTTGVDAQFQGDVGDLSVGLYLNYQFAGKSYAGVASVADPLNYTAGALTAADSDMTGYWIYTSVGIGEAGVRLGMSESKDKNNLSNPFGYKTTTTIVGGWYSLAQNVDLDLEYNANNNDAPLAVDNNITVLMLEYAY